ncbi:MAG TPA: PA14 domain-containing protein, partial [Acidimicrobiales bacterium]|nr:PA14 domain-containing protein [Acidimicrobiales bacterium]
VLERTDPNVNFWWWANAPAPTMPATGWMARWSGYVTVPAASGTSFTFGAYSADGARVVVNNTTVLSSWQDQSAWPNANWGTPITLAPGKYPIRVDYYNNDGPGANDHYGFMALVVKGAVAEQVVPASWLSTEPRPADPHNNAAFVRPGPASPGWSLGAGTLAYSGARLEQNGLVLTDTAGGAHSYRWTGSGYAPVADEDGTVGADTAGGLSVAADDGRTYSLDRAGRVTAAFAPADESGAASLTYKWQDVDGVSRLVELRDPVGGGTVTLDYRRVSSNPCPTTAPSGLAAAPLGALCRIRYVDGSTETKLWYNANGQLARIQDPGDPASGAAAWDKPALTDFGYDAKGRLQTVRAPLANDAIVAGVRAVPANPTPPDGLSPDTTVTYIAYDDQDRATRVSLPGPTGAVLEPRPGRRYEYPGGGETRVRVDGAVEPPGRPWARQVVFSTDAAARTTTVREADATGQATEPAARARTTVFDAADRPIRATDTAGRQAVTVYDGDAARAHSTGRVTDAWGPAPASCFTAYPPPEGACSSQSPPPARSSTAYDADPAASGDPAAPPVAWTGLVATYFRNATLTPAGPGGSGVMETKTTHGAEAKPAADGNLLTALPPGLPAGWSARFRGEIELPAGAREFEVVANGQARLWVGDTLVADAWAGGTPTSARGTFTATAGRHRIRVDYVPSGTPSVLLRWKPSGSFVGVPASALFPRLGNPTISTAHGSDSAPTSRTYSTYTTHVEGLLATQTVDYGPGRLALATTVRYDKVTTPVLVPTSKALPAATPMDGAKGLPLAVTDPSNPAAAPAADRSTRYEYNGLGVTRANPCGPGTANQRGLVWKVTTPDPDGDGPGAARTSERVYDALGRVVASRASVADADWICTSYDARGRVEAHTFPGGRTVTYSYGVGDSPLVTAVADSTAGTITTAVDLLGRPTAYEDRWGPAKKTQSFYDQAGLLVRADGPQGRVDFAYDPAGRIEAQRLA